ncbi:MAG: elongation factor G [Thermoanaerobaculia bacterium]|nr:Elongation factor G [Thermoanaerobaculia bacterium]MCK6683069.1 elongation factor G [Thermoanaerobaculia bacterium]
MKVYPASAIHNVVVAGHNSVGKTTLISALLHEAGAVTRFGRVEDGTAPTDFDPEEIERKISIGLAVASLEWRKRKVNLIDTPGYGIFESEMVCGMRAADSAIIVVDAVAGVEVQTERAWRVSEDLGLPKVVVVNRMDRERADGTRVSEQLAAKFGRRCVCIESPIGRERGFRGVIDLVGMKGFLTDDAGKTSEGPIPAEFSAEAASLHEALVEMVAEGDDALMETFFSQGSLTEEQMLPALRKAIRDRKIIPVLFAAAGNHETGVEKILDEIVDLLPTSDSFTVAARMKDGKPDVLSADTAGPAGAFVFKTISDPFSGRLSLFRVYSGSIKADGTYWNSTRETAERFGTVFAPLGKQLNAVPEIPAGDIGCVAKLKDTLTGDSLATKEKPLSFDPIKFPEPAISFAIEPKSKGDEDKISAAIQRLVDEDPSLRLSRDADTQEFLLAGSGQLHVEIAIARMKRKSNVEVILHPPKVPYRETITRNAEAHGRHKKQTGGHGQFADCKIRVAPLPRGADFQFIDDIFGGSIPRQFIPAVEKGVQEARKRGFLAGFPMVDFKVELFDGQYHDVDSSEMAFKIAGTLAYKDAMAKANPIILEPIVAVTVRAPQEYMGDIMGDLTSRRGRPSGMETEGEDSIIKAEVPMSEMLSYAPVLRSITQGRGSFHMEMDHYEELPRMLQDKLVAERAKLKKAEAEE